MAFPKTFVTSRPTIVAIEQRFCFLLGIVCMAFGVWGICIRHSEGLLPAWLTWLGSAYLPVLRVTAVACLGLGVVLVRLGDAKTLPISESPYPKLTIKPSSPEALQGTGEDSLVARHRVTSQPESERTQPNRAFQTKARGNERDMSK